MMTQKKADKPKQKPTVQGTVAAVQRARRRNPNAGVTDNRRAAAALESKVIRAKQQSVGRAQSEQARQPRRDPWNTNTKTFATRRDPDVDYAERAKMERVVTRAVHAPVIGGKTVNMKSAAKRSAKAAAKQERRVAKKELRGRLADYLRMLENAFESEAVKCPVNYNPVPSQLTSVASTPLSVFNITVAANGTSEVLIFPGHGYELDTEAMDGESYHAQVQTIGLATNYTIGPMANAAVPAALGCITAGLAIGGASAGTNGAGTTVITPSVLLPYQASAGDGSHTRWKLNAATVEVQNTTQEGSRGGNVTFCQMNSMYQPGTSQLNFSSQPTYGYSEEANTGTFRQSWIPRAVDQSFWHTATAGVGAAVTPATGTWKIWLNNPTAVAQTYTFGGQFHWELGGANLVALATPAVLQPADADIIEPSLEVMRFAGKDTQFALQVGSAVAEGASPWVEAVSDFAGSAVKALAGGALEGMTALFM